MGLRSFYAAASKMKEEGKLKDEDLQNMRRQVRYDGLFNELEEMKKMLQQGKIKEDLQFDKIKKNISSYDLKKDVNPYTSSDEKAELHLSNAKAYIRRGEGILSKNMKPGSDTYGVAYTELEDAEKELKNHKNPEEVKKAKAEMANFAEALARKIKIDIEKKDNEYSLKKDLKEEDKKELEIYQKCRAEALEVAEKAVNYARKLIKESSH